MTVIAARISSFCSVRFPFLSYHSVAWSQYIARETPIIVFYILYGELSWKFPFLLSLYYHTWSATTASCLCRCFSIATPTPTFLWNVSSKACSPSIIIKRRRIVPGRTMTKEYSTRISTKSRTKTYIIKPLFLQTFISIVLHHIYAIFNCSTPQWPHQNSHRPSKSLSRIRKQNMSDLEKADWRSQSQLWEPWAWVPNTGRRGSSRKKK